MVIAPVGPASSHGYHRVELVNGLNAPAWRTFDNDHVGTIWPLGRPQAMGPQFTVDKRVTLKEVGGFVNASVDNYWSSKLPPYTVEIRSTTPEGQPALGKPLAVAFMSDDGDASVWRYERARFRLKLRPGAYFAMVTARAPAIFGDARPAGVLGAWDGSDSGRKSYQPDELTIGFINHVSQTTELFPVHQGPFRVVAVRGWRHH
jgi:hypothetical protein